MVEGRNSSLIYYMSSHVDEPYVSKEKVSPGKAALRIRCKTEHRPIGTIIAMFTIAKHTKTKPFPF